MVDGRTHSILGVARQGYHGAAPGIARFGAITEVRIPVEGKQQSLVLSAREQVAVRFPGARHDKR